MAMNNRDRIGKAFDYLAEGLADPVDEIMTQCYGTTDWNKKWAEKDQQKYGSPLRSYSKNDVQIQLRAITEYGREFGSILSRGQEAYASELREVRNDWAHTQPFSSDETIRALSTIEYLLKAVSAPDSEGDVRKLRDDLQRTVYEDHTRKISKRKVLSVNPIQGMKPWRQVITPHRDVTAGTYSASEFAANLYQVAVSKESCKPGDPYGDPVEFFNRTYLTEGLQDILKRAIQRLVGNNTGSPVVNLQTNFGGGKTHSLLALYHLFGDTPLENLSGDIQSLVAEMNLREIWNPGVVHRAAIVGNFLNTGKADIKSDGTKVNTMWGELAWQLGGRQAYEIVAENDINGKPPAQLLVTLLNQYRPCLILIDEWVAYAKQLVGRDDLPAGTFEDQFAFAQTLTEAVAAVPNCMLVVSIPASDDGGISDLEVGGENGRRALQRLQNVVRRKADQWRPSSKDESFEIVRKRLFEQPTAGQLSEISLTARQFVEMYRENPSLYPADVASSDYEKRIRASYPLHPQLLDRLYEDWSSLENFQRTRGVLTLVSSIIHELWASEDSSPLILPGNVPLDSESVNSNLTQYLHDPWKPIIDTDISGPDSTAAHIDNERPILGQRHLTQRIARTIFIGSAPRTTSQNPGITQQLIRLGTATPGDQEGNFGTALSMIEQKSTYFFKEDSRYGYNVQPSIAKTARDYADRLQENPEIVYNEIVTRMSSESHASKRGEFLRVCIAPESNDAIPDVDEATLVIVHPRWSITNGEGQKTKDWIQNALEHRGSSQRMNRNMLIFVAADADSLDYVIDAVRSYLGWKHVADNEDQLNLTHQQVEQARHAMQNLNDAIDDRIRSAYCWCIYPDQPDPQSGYQLRDAKVPDSGGNSIAERTGKRLKQSDQLIDVYSPNNIRPEILDHLKPLYTDGTIPLTVVWENITRFPYMPRLTSRTVFEQALESAADSVLTVDAGDNRFAIAASRNPQNLRFRNLVIPGITPNPTNFNLTDSTLIVDWDTAVNAYEQYQQEDEESKQSSIEAITEDRLSHPSDHKENKSAGPEDDASQPIKVEYSRAQKRYYASVDIDPDCIGRELAKINEGVLEQLRLNQADISISLEISATSTSGGFDENTMAIINKSAESLKFKDSGFEQE